MNKAAQAYCQAEARHWLRDSQRGKHTISYKTHRRQCMQEARAWLKAARDYREGTNRYPWRG